MSETDQIRLAFWSRYLTACSALFVAIVCLKGPYLPSLLLVLPPLLWAFLRRPTWVMGSFLMLLAFASTSHSATPFELAQHWSPVLYHDTDSTEYDSEYIARVDFDGNWKGNDNWENTPFFPKPAYVYWSMIATPSHWVLTYMFFHPRDWSETCATGECHENDAEGVILWIRRDGSDFGALELMQTQAHGYFFAYSGLPLGEGTSNLDGAIRYEDGHPKAYIQSKGHGTWGHAYCGLLTFYACIWFDGAEDFPGADGNIYRYIPARGAEVPVNGNDRDVSYDLLPLTDLWARRYDIGNGRLYGVFGKFDGDTYGTDSADAPWNWHDPTAGMPKGAIFYDPAKAAITQFTGWGTGNIGQVNQTYENNVYGATISGTVRNANTGAPVSSARLQLSNRLDFTFSASDGTYSLSALPGNYTLSIQANGYASAEQSGINVQNLSNQLTINVSLQPLATVPDVSSVWASLACLLCVSLYIIKKVQSA